MEVRQKLFACMCADNKRFRPSANNDGQYRSAAEIAWGVKTF
jgi:hypothetical protein